MIRTAALAAALVMTGGLLAATGGIASASDAPRIAAAAPASSTPARHVVVLEFCTLKSSELCWMTLMAQFNMTEGPAVWAARIRWSSWGNSSATGSGTLWGADAGIFRLGHVTIRLYRPRSYVTSTVTGTRTSRAFTSSAAGMSLTTGAGSGLAEPAPGRASSREFGPCHRTLPGNVGARLALAGPGACSRPSRDSGRQSAARELMSLHGNSAELIASQTGRQVSQ